MITKVHFSCSFDICGQLPQLFFFCHLTNIINLCKCNSHHGGNVLSLRFYYLKTADLYAICGSLCFLADIMFAGVTTTLISTPVQVLTYANI